MANSKKARSRSFTRPDNSAAQIDVIGIDCRHSLFLYDQFKLFIETSQNTHIVIFNCLFRYC